MNDRSREHRLATTHGSIAIDEAGHGDLPVLLIHGNSICRGVFRHQMSGRLAQDYRFIAFALPGHGESGNAPDPSRTYMLPGFADTAVEILGMLGVAEVAGCGGSHRVRLIAWRPHRP